MPPAGEARAFAPVHKVATMEAAMDRVVNMREIANTSLSAPTWPLIEKDGGGDEQHHRYKSEDSASICFGLQFVNIHVELPKVDEFQQRKLSAF